MDTATDTPALTGHCLCGAIRFTAAPPFNWVLHCHCESCRRATASPMTTFVSVPNAQLHWGATPALYCSSRGVARQFCPTCGSPVSYAVADKPDETHIYAALLDDPEAVTPEGHDFVEDAIGWMHPLPETKDAS